MSKKFKIFSPALSCLLWAGCLTLASAESPVDSSLQEQLNTQKQEIEQLKKRLRTQENMLDQTISAVEKGGGGLSPFEKLTLGGYGELHYNNLYGRGGQADKKEIDFHRFVLFFGYEFAHNIRFISELELEHALAGESQPGEIELEQAYIDFALGEAHHLKTGLFLMPIGLINETHEPPAFYGVERNPVEGAIIPSTWWEAGAGMQGYFTPTLSYDLAITSGLKTSAGSKYAIRSGRQKVASATAEDLAITGRIKAHLFGHLDLALALQHQGDITQSLDPAAGSANLIETDAVWTWRGFSLKALYATWDLDGSGPKSVGADEQKGFYIEPSYRFNPKVGVFVRFNQYDNAAGDNVGSEKKQTNFGFNVWPHEQVVLKFDVENQDNDGGRESNGFNLGVGYHF